MQAIFWMTLVRQAMLLYSGLGFQAYNTKPLPLYEMSLCGLLHLSSCVMLSLKLTLDMRQQRVVTWNCPG